MDLRATTEPARVLRSDSVRRANLGTVLDVVRRGPLSRSELVERTGLTRSAIAGLVAELAELELVEERLPASDGRPGRPSPVVSADVSHLGALAMELGVDSLAVAVVAIDGTIIHSIRAPHRRPGTGPDSSLSAIVDLADQVVSTLRSPFAFLGIAAAVAGAVRAADSRVTVAPNLGWLDFDLVAELSAALHARLGLDRPIAVANEADLGGLAESRFGAATNADHLLYVTGEVGIGGSVIVHGQRLMGHRGYAGEIGHLQINPEGSTCRCGATGCWETEAGERVLLDRAGIDPDEGAAGVDRLFERAARGDRRAIDAIDETGRWLGIGLAGLINVIDPDLILMGGLFGRLLPRARHAIESELRDRRFRGIDRDVPLAPGALGLNAGLIGAAELVAADLLGDPSGVVRSLSGFSI